MKDYRIRPQWTLVSHDSAQSKTWRAKYHIFFILLKLVLIKVRVKTIRIYSLAL